MAQPRSRLRGLTAVALLIAAVVPAAAETPAPRPAERPAAGQTPTPQAPGRPSPPAPVAAARPAASQVIAVVDFGAVLEQAAAARSLDTQMRTEQQAFDDAVEAQQQEFRAQEEELERQRSGLSPEAFLEQRRGLQERMRQADERFRQRRRALEEAFAAAMTELQRTMAAVLPGVAQRAGATIVLRRELVPYSPPGSDLTSATLEALDAALPSVRLAVPEPAQP